MKTFEITVDRHNYTVMTSDSGHSIASNDYAYETTLFSMKKIYSKIDACLAKEKE